MRQGLNTRVKTRYQVECFGLFHKDDQQCPEPKTCRQLHQVRLKWKTDFTNLVVTEGLNLLLDNSFNAAASSVAWYVGLMGAGTGTCAETASANAITGTSTVFTAADVGSDIIVVGAGAAGADLITTVASRSSNTAITTTANASTTVTVAPYAVECRPADVMNSHYFLEDANYSESVRQTWTKNASSSGGAMSNSSAKAAFSINGTTRLFGAFMVGNSTKSGTTGQLYGGGLFTTSGSRAVISGDTVNVQIDLAVTATP